MSSEKSGSKFIRTKSSFIGASIDDLLNQYFEKYEVRLKEKEDFFVAYLSYLENQREAVKEDLIDSIRNVSEQSISDQQFVRLVDLKYITDPLSTKGSLKGNGGRFNIGSELARFKQFSGLYLASDDGTAYAEKFHYSPTYTKGDLSGEGFALRGNKDYAVVGLNVNIGKCIDLTEKEKLRDFASILSGIKPNKELIEWGTSLGILKLKTVQTHGELLKNLLDPEFLKTCMALERPANSQWFGYFCLQAEVQAIKYPSVRNEKGVNLVLLVDNFKDTESYVELTTTSNVIDSSRRRIDGKNKDFFMFDIPSRVDN
jgi:hypothetical protein